MARKTEWKFIARRGHRLWNWGIVLCFVPEDITPGTMCLAFGFNSGCDLEYDQRELRLYVGYRDICIYATSERLIEERRSLLTGLRVRYLEALSRAPSL